MEGTFDRLHVRKGRRLLVNDLAVLRALSARQGKRGQRVMTG